MNIQPCLAGESVVDDDQIQTWILQLSNPEMKEYALSKLSQNRDVSPDLAIYLWCSFGTMNALLFEITRVYSSLMPPNLTTDESNRVCNVMALLQTLVCHPETRPQCIQASIPTFLYPFINTSSKSRQFEYLRLTALGVIGSLAKWNEPKVIRFLLETEIIPSLLKIMRYGSELSKTAATFILQKILLDDVGLSHACGTSQRFIQVVTVLEKMVLSLAKDPSINLLKHILICYVRLCDNPKAKKCLLLECLPKQFKDDTFAACCQEDEFVMGLFEELNRALELELGSVSSPSVVDNDADGQRCTDDH